MPLGLSNAPLPTSDAITRPPRTDLPEGVTDQLAGTLTDTWIEYFQRLVAQVTASPFVKNQVSVANGNASIGATDFSTGGLGAGLFRITYYAAIVQAASTSSSLTVTFSWTDRSVAKALAGSAITGNTTATVQTGSLMVRIDSNTPIRYATTYASVGGTPMNYDLRITLEQMPTTSAI